MSSEALFPKISIVTPSFNQGLFLEECIRSIIEQNYPNLEYIVLDGGSSDLSPLILERYSKYFHYWRSNPDNGQYAAIEEGFNMATGEILFWLNSDDMLHLGSLFKVAKIFQNNPSIDWITGIPTAWDVSSRLTYIDSSPIKWNRERFLNIFDNQPVKFMQQESTFFTRELWNKSGAYLNKDYSLAADFELWLRFSRICDVHCIDAILGGFRVHSDQKSSKFYQHYIEDVKKALADEILNHGNYKLSNDKNAFINREAFYIATSIAPKNFLIQKKAIASWISNGFTPISFNNSSEIKVLANIFPEVQFQSVSETAQQETGKPLVYINDIISHFFKIDKAFALINSDILFSINAQLADIINRQLTDSASIFLASRVEIENDVLQFHAQPNFSSVKYGRNYYCGFDLFVFSQSSVKIFKKQLDSNVVRFALGIPWWDYFIPTLALIHGVKCFYLFPSPICHFYHEAIYSKELWRKYGLDFIKSVSSQLSLDYNIRHANNCLKSDDQIDAYLNSICSQAIRLITNNFEKLSLGSLLVSSYLLSSSVSGIEAEMLNFNNDGIRYINECVKLKNEIKSLKMIECNMHKAFIENI